MEFNKTIAARQSVRKFTEAQITDEQLKAILEAANAAPACMGQYDHLHLTVVQKPEILVQINAAFQKAVGDPNVQVTYGAPTVIYVSCKNEDEEIIKGCNAGVVMENMLLAATDQAWTISISGALPMRLPKCLNCRKNLVFLKDLLLFPARRWGYAAESSSAEKELGITLAANYVS